MHIHPLAVVNGPLSFDNLAFYFAPQSAWLSSVSSEKRSLMDELEEAMVANSAQFNSKGLRSLFFLHEIQDEIYTRLVESGNQEAVSNPRLKEDLDEHFSRLPASYALDVHVDKAEDVLLHKNILAQSAIKENRPVFHARFLRYIRQAPDETESDDDETQLPTNLMKDNDTVPLHEIIFSSLDKPKLLSQLSVLLSNLGLNIREAHVFSTLDGFCLDVFIVDGWPVEDTDGLLKKLKETAKTENVNLNFFGKMKAFLAGLCSTLGLLPCLEIL